jgi:large subunit ribosomal protein L18
MIKKEARAELRKRRHARVRKVVHGTADQPRLSVFKSLKHFYAQVIDDDRGVTLASASTLDKEIESGEKADRARLVGEKVAERAVEKGVRSVVFDRSGYKYHGKVAAIAQGARSKGLEF